MNLCYLVWTAGLALADPGAGASDSARGLAWTMASGRPAIRVDAPGGTPIELTVRAKLAELTWTWTVGPVRADDDGDTLVFLDVPREAWLNDAARDYVTDLFAVVDVGTVRLTPGPGYLAWTRGQQAPPIVMNTAQMRARAPQGVLDPALRLPDAGPADRVMPDLGAASEPGAKNVAPSDTERAR